MMNNPRMILILCAIGLVLIASCLVSPPPTTIPNQADSLSLTPDPTRFDLEDARAALLRYLDEGNNDILSMSRDVLAKDAAVPAGNGGYAIGPWNLNLLDRLFSVNVESKIGFIDYYGHFELRGSKWVAVEDDTVRGTAEL